MLPFVRFLEYTDDNGVTCYVAVDDISCVTIGYGGNVLEKSEISLKSDTEYILSAKGMPSDIIKGKVVEI